MSHPCLDNLLQRGSPPGLKLSFTAGSLQLGAQGLEQAGIQENEGAGVAVRRVDEWCLVRGLPVGGVIVWLGSKLVGWWSLGWSVG